MTRLGLMMCIVNTENHMRLFYLYFILCLLSYIYQSGQIRFIISVYAMRISSSVHAKGRGDIFHVTHFKFN